MQKGKRKKQRYALTALAALLGVVFIGERIISHITPASAAADAVIYIDPAAQAVIEGEDFSVEVMINPLNHWVSNADLYVTYDETKFSLVSITPSAIFSNVLTSSVPSTPDGTGSFSASTPFNSYITKTETYATLNFHAIATVIDSPITITPATMVYADNSPAYPSEAGINVVGTRTGGTVTIAVSGSDVTAPVISGGAPSGTLPVGTTSAVLSVATDENATCKYASSPGTAFDAMTDTFEVTGEMTHTKNISGLANGADYAYYVRCSDGNSNKNQTDFALSFSVEEETVVEEEPDPQDAPVVINIPRPKIKVDDEKKSVLAYFKEGKRLKFYGEIKELAEGEIRIYKDGKQTGATIIDKDGNWSTKLKFEESTKLKLYFYDKNGTEVGTKKYRIRIDGEDPKFTDLPLNLRKKPGDKIWWKATDNKKIDYYKYEIAGKEKKTDDDFFYLPKDISKGPHTAKISAFDKAGNKETRIVLVLVW